MENLDIYNQRYFAQSPNGHDDKKDEDKDDQDSKDKPGEKEEDEE